MPVMINPATGLPYQIGDAFGTGSTVTGFTPSGAPAITGNPRPSAPPPAAPANAGQPPAASSQPPSAPTVPGIPGQPWSGGQPMPIAPPMLTAPLNTQGVGGPWVPTAPSGNSILPGATHSVPGPMTAPSSLTAPQQTSSISPTAPASPGPQASLHSPSPGGPTVRIANSLGSRMLAPSLRNTGRWGRTV